MLPNVFLISLVIGGKWFAVAEEKITSMDSNKLDPLSESVNDPEFGLDTVDSKSLKRIARQIRRSGPKKETYTENWERRMKSDFSTSKISKPNILKRRKPIPKISDKEAQSYLATGVLHMFRGPTIPCNEAYTNLKNITYINSTFFDPPVLDFYKMFDKPNPNKQPKKELPDSVIKTKKFRFLKCIPKSERYRTLKSNKNLAERCWEILTKNKDYSMYGEGEQTIERVWYRLSEKIGLHDSPKQWFAPDRCEAARPMDSVKKIPWDMTKLRMSKCKLKRLETGDLKHSRLRELDLHDNEITEIDNGAIEMPVLVNLTLSKNRLSNIGSLTSLPSSLETLSLADNNIATVETGSFSNLENLQDLDLSGNHIDDMGIGAFKYLGDLTWLDLSRNSITHIQTGVFNGLKKLRSLILRRNKMHLFVPKLFQLPKLRSLDLSKNKLRIIRKGDVGASFPLCFLDLSDNPMKVFRDGAFYGVERRFPCNVVLRRVPITSMRRSVFHESCIPPKINSDAA